VRKLSGSFDIPLPPIELVIPTGFSREESAVSPEKEQADFSGMNPLEMTILGLVGDVNRAKLSHKWFRVLPGFSMMG